MQAVFFGVAHDLAAVKFRGVVRLLGGGLQFVQIDKAGLYALDLAAQAGQLKIPVGLAELAEGKHKDPRALIYTIGNLDPERKRPFAEDDISYLDFGRKSSAYSALKKAGLIEPLTPSEEIEKALTKDELLALVRERGLPDTGKKRALADRLAGSGYKLNRRKTGGHLFRLTETGAGIVTVCRNDKRAAINRAIAALKERPSL